MANHAPGDALEGQVHARGARVGDDEVAGLLAADDDEVGGVGRRALRTADPQRRRGGRCPVVHGVGPCSVAGRSGESTWHVGRYPNGPLPRAAHDRRSRHREKPPRRGVARAHAPRPDAGADLRHRRRRRRRLPRPRPGLHRQHDRQRRHPRHGARRRRRPADRRPAARAGRLHGRRRARRPRAAGAAGRAGTRVRRACSPSSRALSLGLAVALFALGEDPPTGGRAHRHRAARRGDGAAGGDRAGHRGQGRHDGRRHVDHHRPRRRLRARLGQGRRQRPPGPRRRPHHGGRRRRRAPARLAPRRRPAALRRRRRRRHRRGVACTTGCTSVWGSPPFGRAIRDVSKGRPEGGLPASRLSSGCGRGWRARRRTARPRCRGPPPWPARPWSARWRGPG